MNELQFAVSIARRSGHLKIGFDRVRDLVLREETDLVIMARDLSEKNRARVERFCAGKADAVTVDLTQFDFSQAAGKLTGILAADDANMSRLLRNAVRKMKGEQ